MYPFMSYIETLSVYVVRVLIHSLNIFKLVNLYFIIYVKMLNYKLMKLKIFIRNYCFGPRKKFKRNDH